MFRSGTTFLARMLNVHSNIICASDPMRPLFNSFRYDIADEYYKKHHKRFDPLGDYFFTETELLKQILSSNFSREINFDKKELLNIIKNAAKPFSGLWADKIQLNENYSSYKDIIDYFLYEINEVYRKKDEDSRIISFKEVWTNEFVPAFLKTYPESKSIIMLRDPRAVLASNNVTEAKYPVIFMARQWRKLAFLAAYCKKHFPNRVDVLKYEDLVTNPEKEVKDVCEFLNIDFEEKLLDLSKYLDGDNNPWRQNTSYDSKKVSGISSESLNKWKNVLDEQDLLLNELICSDWMDFWGYQVNYPGEKLESLSIKDVKRIKTENLSNWIRPYSFDEDDTKFAEEFLKEKLRLMYLNSAISLPEEKFKLQINDNY